MHVKGKEQVIVYARINKYVYLAVHILVESNICIQILFIFMCWFLCLSLLWAQNSAFGSLTLWTNMWWQILFEVPAQEQRIATLSVLSGKGQ